MKGPFNYGRYDDDPGHVGCPRANSDMTPCAARDGHIVLSSDADRVCVGCERNPIDLLHEVYPETLTFLMDKPEDLRPVFAADLLAAKVRELTEPPTEEE